MSDRHTIFETARRPSVLMVETSGAGGMAHYTYNLCQALARRAPVHLVTSAPYELIDLPRSFELHTKYRSAWVVRDMKRAHRLRATLTNCGNLGMLASLTRAVRPEIVHVQGHVSPRLQPMLVRLSEAVGGPPVVATVHEVLPYEQAERFRNTWSVSYRSVDGLIAHSRFVVGELEREFDHRGDVGVVPHGDYSFFRRSPGRDRVAACRARGLPVDRRLLLFFGYVRPYKGLDLLASAWQRAVRDGLPADVDVVVAGSVAPDAQAHVAALAEAADSRLHLFAGYVDDQALEDYLTAADAVVAPYHLCYTSGVVPLAFSFGQPVVATRVGSICEQVRPGHNGLLADAGDPADLARALVRFFARENRAALSRGAIASAERLSWDVIARDTLLFYGRILGRSRGPRPVVWEPAQ